MTKHTPITRRSRGVARRLEDGRILLEVASSGLFQPYRPLITHLMITRRCNLSCTYCYEADRVSPPVPTATLKQRIDHLARLRSILVTLTGGEPLLHPDLPELVSHIRDCGMTPVMNTNGYLLTRERIAALGEAGLYALQLSVDNVTPNDATQKSLKPLMPKLRLLAEHAVFRVRINTVLGAGPPEQAVEVVRAAVALGFDAKCSLVRDAHGAVIPLADNARRAYDVIRLLGRRSSSLLSEDFQVRLARDGRVEWKCRSGARYFLVCENGLVHFCESSHGDPGTPLADYTEADIRRAFHAPKSCAPTCAVAYAHQASRLDRFRSQLGQPREIVKDSWLEASERQCAGSQGGEPACGIAVMRSAP